jgi:hypothetical protein
MDDTERWPKIRRILAGLQTPNKKCIIIVKPVHYVLRRALWNIVRQPQHERKYDTAFCHALVSRTDRKGKGEGGCRQETYKKRMVLLCSRDRKHGAKFTRISLLEEIQGGVEFNFRLHVRKKVLAAFSSNWGNSGYTTNALRNSGYIHVDSQPRADQVSGKRYSCPVPNSPSWERNRDKQTRSKAFKISVPESGEWSVWCPGTFTAARRASCWIGSIDYTDVVIDSDITVQLGIEP